jgi:ribosomal protein L16/L10AE
MKHKIKRPFRSIIYKTKMRLLFFKKNNNVLISTRDKLIHKPCTEAARIVISRQFQKKKKFSKHKRFQYIMKISKKRRAKYKYKPFLIKRLYFPILLSYKKKLLPLIIKKRNKKRMRFKDNFFIPITKKGNKSRMGKGKGIISSYMCHLYLNNLLFNLYRISKYKKFTVFKKLKMKLGGLKPKFIKKI